MNSILVFDAILVGAFCLSVTGFNLLKAGLSLETFHSMVPRFSNFNAITMLLIGLLTISWINLALQVVCNPHYERSLKERGITFLMCAVSPFLANLPVVNYMSRIYRDSMTEKTSRNQWLPIPLVFAMVAVLSAMTSWLPRVISTFQPWNAALMTISGILNCATLVIGVRMMTIVNGKLASRTTTNLS